MSDVLLNDFQTINNCSVVNINIDVKIAILAIWVSTLIGLATVMVTTLVIAWRTAKMITKHMIPTQPDVIVVEGNSETLNPQFGDPDFNQQNESIEKFYEKLPGSELQEFQP